MIEIGRNQHCAGKAVAHQAAQLEPRAAAELRAIEPLDALRGEAPTDNLLDLRECGLAKRDDDQRLGHSTSSRYTSTVAWTARSQVKSRATFARAAWPTWCRRLASASNSDNREANGSASPGGTRKPLTPSSMVPRRPPTSEATTGRPLAMASRATMPC